MSVLLLDKTRKINRVLHNTGITEISFDEICHVLTDVMDSCVIAVSKKGKILGISHGSKVKIISELLGDRIGDRIDSQLNDRLQGILSTKENVFLQTLGFSAEVEGYHAMITPIDVAGERLGTLIIYRDGNAYEIDDIILCEYGAVVIGLEMMRAVIDENEEEVRKATVVKAALKALSSSELDAIYQVFEELKGRNGLLVASRVAEKTGLTRSVIVNALKKLESAGVVEVRSAGMKGTKIRICNDMLMDELENIKNQ